MESRSFGLNLKFSIVIGCILLSVCALMSILIYWYLRDKVIKEAEDKTTIIMTHVRATGEYVRETLRPAIFSALQRLNARDEFIIEAMSTTHVSMQIMRRFNQEIEDYIFRRVSDNPLNPHNRADAFHLEMLSYFRENPQEQFWKGVVTLDGKKYLYMLNPVIFDVPCLKCHGDPSLAPPQLLKTYGNTGGFWRRPGEIVGLNSVSVPLDKAFEQIRKLALDIFLLSMSSLFFMFIALYLSFRHIVTKPINDLSKTFKDIVEGKEPLGKAIHYVRKDEIGDLTESFNILSKHLFEAQEKLKKTAEIEKQMIETEKLTVIGQLSAGVAHEINNPLGGMKLCFNNLLNTNMDEETKREHIEVINSGFNRIQSIVKQLLDFSRNTPLSLSKASINKILDNVLMLSEYTIASKGIKIVKDYSDDIPDLLVDQNKLEQVFLNLILNAIQAMNENGVLTLKSWYNDYCYVSVSDTGKGIPSDILPKIFDPFFTTKGSGKGTGLGLTVSKAIIEQHKGEIMVETSSKGSTFIVKLPIIQ